MNTFAPVAILKFDSGESQGAPLLYECLWTTLFSPWYHLSLSKLQVGEITFFDLATKQDVATVYVSGCIDTLLLAHHTDSATHLLVRTTIDCASFHTPS